MSLVCMNASASRVAISAIEALLRLTRSRDPHGRGLGPLHPDGISPLVLVEALIADLPSARTDPETAQAAHRASVSWEQEFETLASWFEAGEAVQKLLQPLRTRKRRIEAVSARLLPKTEILGRTLRLNGSNLEGGCRRRG
jgi:hypothetical protein